MADLLTVFQAEYSAIITHASGSCSMGSVISCVCDMLYVCVCALNGKWLELLMPKLLEV